MGADLLIYVCEHPDNRGWDQEKAEQELVAFAHSFEGLNAVWEFFEYGLGGIELEELYAEQEGDLEKLVMAGKDKEALASFGRRYIAQTLVSSYREVFLSHRRDVAVIKLHGREYAVSGGMSWGDTPSDACELIQILAESGVFCTEGDDESQESSDEE